MVEINVLQIIQLLKHEMAWVIEDVATRMFFCRFPKALKRNSIVQVFARMYFIAKVDSRLVKGVQNGKPSFCKFLKRS